MKRKPDFILIGAAKAGTTTLFDYLAAQQSIYASEQKEPEYFARDDIYRKGFDWYQSLFDGAKVEQSCFEASTIYSMSPIFPDTAKRMFIELPDVKLIYLLRNPIDRAYSYYLQLVKNFQNCYSTDRVPFAFEELLFDEQFSHDNTGSEMLATYDAHLPYCSDLLLCGGLYHQQLNSFLSYYSDASVHCVVLEHLSQNPDAELNAIFDFLDISPPRKFEDFAHHSSNISSTHFQRKRLSMLLSKLTRIPIVGALAKNNLPQDNKLRAKSRLMSMLKYSSFGKQVTPQSMSQEARSFLSRYYLEPTEKLSAQLDIDFKSLWKMSD